MHRSAWQDIAHQVQGHRDYTVNLVEPRIPDVPSPLPPNVTAIPRALLSSREVEITTTCAEGLVALLASGTLTSTEVTNAFLRRAGLAQKLTNCITEVLPERALTRAQELDDYLKENKKPRGPLHGLPISVKEHFGMKGLSLNAGFIAWADQKADEDALLLKILWQAGCVFYVRTTEPQTLMHLETSSNLYGTTVNPFDRRLTPGGSSGGEGALIGLRGSCLGIGSDIGGSIRSPAANNGLYGLRPTTRRIPRGGSAAPQLGSGYVEGVVGPLSTSLEGIKMFMKTVLTAQPWVSDPTLVPIPWRDEQLFSKRDSRTALRIAVLWDDGVVKPHPPVTRALRQVVDGLNGTAGIQVVDWKPYKHDLAWELISNLYYPDGGDQTTELIESSGEPWRPLSRFIISENPHVKHRSIGELLDLKLRKEKYSLEYAQHWNSTASGITENGDLQDVVDVILCPASPGVAPPLDASRYWAYTSQWNLLDYPALVFPVTTVDPALDVRDEEYLPKNERDQYNHDLYPGPEKYSGLPVSLQLVGRRYEDEKIVEALAYMQQEIGLSFI